MPADLPERTPHVATTSTFAKADWYAAVVLSWPFLATQVVLVANAIFNFRMLHICRALPFCLPDLHQNHFLKTSLLVQLYMVLYVYYRNFILLWKKDDFGMSSTLLGMGNCGCLGILGIFVVLGCLATCCCQQVPNMDERSIDDLENRLGEALALQTQRLRSDAHTVAQDETELSVQSAQLAKDVESKQKFLEHAWCWNVPVLGRVLYPLSKGMWCVQSALEGGYSHVLRNSFFVTHPPRVRTSRARAYMSGIYWCWTVAFTTPFIFHPVDVPARMWVMSSACTAFWGSSAGGNAYLWSRSAVRSHSEPEPPLALLKQRLVRTRIPMIFSRSLQKATRVPTRMTPCAIAPRSLGHITSASSWKIDILTALVGSGITSSIISPYLRPGPQTICSWSLVRMRVRTTCLSEMW